MEQTGSPANYCEGGLHKPNDTLIRPHSPDVGGKVAVDQCFSQQHLQEEQQKLNAQATSQQEAESLQQAHQPAFTSTTVPAAAQECSLGAATEPAAEAAALLPQPPKDACLAWIEAAKEGDVREMHQLLQQFPGLLNYQPLSGLRCSALHWAAARGHTEALQGLLLWSKCSQHVVSG
jgi:hypothetical protein